LKLGIARPFGEDPDRKIVLQTATSAGEEQRVARNLSPTGITIAVPKAVAGGSAPRGLSDDRRSGFAHLRIDLISARGEFFKLSSPLFTFGLSPGKSIR
jgi:hypothetical protein